MKLGKVLATGVAEERPVGHGEVVEGPAGTEEFGDLQDFEVPAAEEAPVAR